MRVLWIEDVQEMVANLTPVLEQIAGAPKNLTIAKSRDGAIAALSVAASRNEFYDIFILDLALPPSDIRKEEVNVEHGMAVFYHFLHCAPRTPIFILTSSDFQPVVSKLLRHAEQIDVWGDRQLVPTVQLAQKMFVNSFLDELRSVANRVAKLDNIEVVPRDLELNPQQRRIFRVFTRRRKSCSCEVSTLAGGLSSFPVYRVTAFDARGHISIVAAGKIANIAAVLDEHERFNQHIKRLKAGAFPQRIEEVLAGAGLTAGVFYWLLNANSESLFSLLAVDPNRAAVVVQEVQNLTKPWVAGVATTQVADIRRRLLDDKEARDLIIAHGLNWSAEFEKKSIQTREACLHGDLHGGNILVDRNGNPLLIDFSEVGPGAASIDPVTLELSLLFHPSFQDVTGGWPSTETAALWTDCSRYTQDCPCSLFVKACRNWSHKAAAGNRELYASAYAYLLLQLKYPNTNRRLIFALLGAVRRSFEDTYD